MCDTGADAEVAIQAAEDGYVAGSYFARWNPCQEVRPLVHLILGGPVEKQVRDFFDGFIAGAEAERARSSKDDDGKKPFTVEWSQQVEISRGDTEWIVGPRPVGVDGGAPEIEPRRPRPA